MREPQVIGAEYTDLTPFAQKIALEFDEPMNVAQTPGDINVEFVYDAIPGWLPFHQWNDATHAQYSLALPGAPETATVQLKVRDVHLKDLDGLVCLTSDPIVIVP